MCEYLINLVLYNLSIFFVLRWLINIIVPCYKIEIYLFFLYSICFKILKNLYYFTEIWFNNCQVWTLTSHREAKVVSVAREWNSMKIACIWNRDVESAFKREVVRAEKISLGDERQIFVTGSSLIENDQIFTNILSF